MATSPTSLLLTSSTSFLHSTYPLRATTFRCSSSSPPPPPRPNQSYKWCAGLASLGLIETSYLSYTKLFGVDAFCTVSGGEGGGACGDVLNSDYAFAFGIPLPLFGMVAYGLVAFLGLQLSSNNVISTTNKTDLRLPLLAITTSMVTASAYFLYILSTKFAGTSCAYCLSSAFLSFSLFLITIKDFRFQELQKTLGLQVAVAGIIVAALSSSYSVVQPQLAGIECHYNYLVILGSSDFELEPFVTEINTSSTPFAISLAKHLHSVGAKMYGAFWCSHCIEQKQMFGREAMQIVDYVECFPNGAGKGRKMVKQCSDIGTEGFPTWMIKDQVISGEQDLQALAEASDFADGPRP